MVVPVLMTNCQVSEKPNTGPEVAHRATAIDAMPKATGEPAHLVTRVANRSKKWETGLRLPVFPGRDRDLDPDGRFTAFLVGMALHPYMHGL